MKNKVVRALLTTAVCVSMLGTTCFAADQDLTGTGTTTITGDSTVENPIYKVTVPTNITFAVDPFEQKSDAGSQIYSQDLGVINKSNVAVKVTATVKVEGAVDSEDNTKKLVTVVDAESKVTETDTSKKVYIAAQIPSAVTETHAAAAAYLTALKKDGDGKYYEENNVPDGVTASAMTEMVDTTAVTGTYTTSKKVTVGESDTELVFVLAAAQYQEYCTDKTDLTKTATQYREVAASTDGSAVFRFWGKVNTKAAWAANDLSATVKYDLIGLTATNYTAMKPADGADAHAYVATTPESDGTTAVRIKFTGTKPAVGTVVIKSPGSAAAYTPNASSYPNLIEITDSEIVIKTEWLANWKTMDGTWGTGQYTVTAGGQSYKFVLK